MTITNVRLGAVTGPAGSAAGVEAITIADCSWTRWQGGKK